MTGMKTVFLVDDDASVCRALERVLREAGFAVQAYGSAEAFLARPDLAARGCLVLDVSMPGLDGLALQSELSVSGERLPIVFLTGCADVPMSVRAMKAGAADFLTKPVAAATLVAAVHHAMAQDEAGKQMLGETGALAQRFQSLTPRERQVLAALVGGKLGKQIADELGVVEQTVKFHRARIMKRMHARTLAELMYMAAKLDLGAGSAGQAR